MFTVSSVFKFYNPCNYNMSAFCVVPFTLISEATAIVS